MMLDVFFWNLRRYLRGLWLYPLQTISGVQYKLFGAEGNGGGRALVLWMMAWTAVGTLIGLYGWWRVYGRNFVIWHRL